MKRMFLLAVSLLAIPAAASAQAAPDAGGEPPRPPVLIRRAFDAAGPLRATYRLIGLAEALGASGRYLESARTHYRAAYTSYQQHDTRKAVAQARVASDLTRAALVGHTPTPRNLPAPPSPAPRAGGPEGFAQQEEGVGFGDRATVRAGGFEGPGPAFRRERGAREVDVVELAEIQRRDSSPEVRQLVSDALAATSAAQRAALAGDVDGAERQNRIAVNLAAAARDLAFANAPAPSRSPAPRSQG